MKTDQKIVLIVEDEAPLRKALVRKFVSKGFDVREARDGAEGLGMALLGHPHLILLDIIMPVMDGMTMLNALRKDPWGKDARVIMLTNLSDETTTQKALETGAHDFLVKASWTLDDVILRADVVLAKPVATAASPT